MSEPLDGGQPSPAKLSDGTPLKLPAEVPFRGKGVPEKKRDRAPDGLCNGIWSAKRTLVRDQTMVTIKRASGRDVTETRHGFQNESRPIEAWIDLSKLSFTASIIELVKNGGRVRPSPPEDGVVPNIEPTNLDATIK
ncbi:MAG: hypothetical protein ABI548_09970 [Polyangiaceae bacterium]